VKGFPENVDGPLGPWFKRVREAVAQVRAGAPRDQVIAQLGPPDEVRRDATSAGGQLQDLVENVAGGPTAMRYGDKVPVPETLVYRDPYRPRKRYLFGLRDGVVYSSWEETSAQ
jgi:hypothetical protein